MPDIGGVAWDFESVATKGISEGRWRSKLGGLGGVFPQNILKSSLGNFI